MTSFSPARTLSSILFATLAALAASACSAAGPAAADADDEETIDTADSELRSRRCGAGYGRCGAGTFCRYSRGVCGSAPGRCRAKPDACLELLGDPVCGCNGTTYGSACDADTAGVSIAHRGECN